MIGIATPLQHLQMMLRIDDPSPGTRLVIRTDAAVLELTVHLPGPAARRGVWRTVVPAATRCPPRRLLDDGRFIDTLHQV
jgi:hypothetical protein